MFNMIIFTVESLPSDDAADSVASSGRSHKERIEAKIQALPINDGGTQ